MQIAEINRRIAGIRKRRESNRTAIQTVAVGIVEHANDTGDCTAAVRLCRAMEPKLRSQVIRWFGLYSPINVKMGKTAADDKCNLRKEEQNGFNAFNVDGARANNWWEVETPESAPKVYGLTSFREDVHKVIERYEKKINGDNPTITGDEAAAICADLRTLHEAIQTNGQREATPAREDLAGPPVAVEAA